jgi:hypothetical protein
MKRPTQAKLQAQIDAWNATHPIGADVDVLTDRGKIVRTKTRSAAELLSGHSAVIWLDGISGCYALDRVTAVEMAGVEGIESSSSVLETGALPLS